jgi:hypothetical protein
MGVSSPYSVVGVSAVLYYIVVFGGLLKTPLCRCVPFCHSVLLVQVHKGCVP